MTSDSVARSQAEVGAGIQAHNEGRRDDAGIHFWRALASLDGVREPRERRSLYSEIAGIFARGGYNDLALMAVQDAIDAARRLGDEKALAADLMEYANTHLRLGNRDEAEATYRSLLKRCVARRDFANAASASTNLAAILANDGYLADAIDLLENSLEYLERVSFPDTELNTRLALVQALDLAGGPPGRILEVARVLVDRFLDELPPPLVERVTKAVDGAIERHVREHPELSAEHLKERDFARLYAVRS